MNTRNQIVLALGIVALSAGSVGAYSVWRQPEAGGGAASTEHQHAGAAPQSGGAPVRLTAEGGRRIGITYATAEVRTLVNEVRAVGNVTYDETRVTSVSPKIEGWVERLYVDFTGAPVRRGQPLMEVYSPTLVSAQEELILARRLADEAASGGSAEAAGNARDLLESARRRLRYLDVPASEVQRIERSGTPRRTLPLTSTAAGVVVQKNVVQGTRVMPGMELYRVADLSTVWVEAEVFEKDLSLVRLGQHAVLTFEALPGQEFEGRVTYVYPDVSVEARTGRVRLDLPNPGLKLKPGMFATVLLHLAEPRRAVVVPRTAVHETGERALVFARAADGTLTPREVKVGLASGSDIEVLSGLAAGEVVVSSAGFLVDAESNMGASMEAMKGMEREPSAAPSASAPAGSTGPNAGQAAHAEHPH